MLDRWTSKLKLFIFTARRRRKLPKSGANSTHHSGFGDRRWRVPMPAALRESS
jgi:hypothetical protein